jgi:hypothetical protein
MSQRIPIYIPTFISDQNYNPNRVLPRILFFNGMLDCETYCIESGSLNTDGSIKEVSQFPYFDHYNVVSGSFPTSGSDSLLFNNENPVYGQQPTENLFTNYWTNYVELLYNPKTRLLAASAIIPLADYFDMELNDIVNWRGNYYHLRAINEYNLKTGECKIQLLGPIIADTFGGINPFTTTTTTTTSTTTTTTTTTAAPTTTTTSTTTTTGAPSAILDWSFSETGGANGEMIIYVNGSAVETRTSTAAGTRNVYVGDTIYVELEIFTACGSPDTYANVYTAGNIINDSACANGTPTALTTGTYTVVSGDIGSTLVLDTYAACDGGCL